MMREVIGGKGHGNMEPLQLHFGMNYHMSALGMTIYWPSRDDLTNQRKVTYIDGPIESNIFYTFVEDIGFVGMKGDVNDDGQTNVVDIVQLIEYIFLYAANQSFDFISETDLLRSDINADNQLNIMDVVLLVNIILGD